MTPERTINLLRVLFVVFAGFIGLLIGDELAAVRLIGLAGGLAFGLVLVLIDRLLKGISLRVFSSATFGLLVGFIFARLLLASNILRGLPEDAEWLAGLAVYAGFAYLGMMLAVRSNRDEFSLIIPYVRFRRATVQEDPLIVDSNVIIDGRLPELCATGFVSKALIVPRFVLDELQRLADSNDPQKRERGRAALARLEQMQRDPALSLTIHDGAVDPDMAVDAQLVQAAKLLSARLLSNDANLNAIARIDGVQVLNLHDLARALRPIVEPGRPLDLALVKEGRDTHQAVGYLSDGTMIVVNQARSFIGQTVSVIVTSTLQTSAGRLFFAEMKLPEPATS
ncbi:MAG: PIN domain-containing protein [Chthoniobacteraceae bacterium]